MYTSPCSTASHLLFRVREQNCWHFIYCMEFESYVMFGIIQHRVDHDKPVDAMRSSSNHPHIPKEGYETFDQQWMSLLAARYPIPFEERGTQSLTLSYMKIESCFQYEWHRVDHKGHVDANRSSSIHPHTSKERYETLKQQCMSLLVAQHPNFCAERVPWGWHFAPNLRVICSRNDTMWTILVCIFCQEIF